MRKTIIKQSAYLLVYYLIVTVVNGLYSFAYWPLYIGGVVGLLMSYADDLLHVFVLNNHELTSQRVISLVKAKQYKEALILLYDTKDERKNLIFHTIEFQLIFTILTFWVITSSGNLFARGLVLGYFLSLVISNMQKFINGELILPDKDKTRIYFAGSVLALLIFTFLI